MWFVTHSRSDNLGRPGARHLALALFASVAIILPSLGTFAALVTTDRYIIQETSQVREDQYVTAVSAIIEGSIDGDLTIFTGSLTIRGDITGTVTVFSSGNVVVEETGTIGGSLNGSATSVNVRGVVGGDIFVGAGSVVVEETGTVGRDLFAFGGTARVDGTVGRDLRGRAFRTTIDGSVGGDVDVATQSLSVASTAVVSGDIVYRSPVDADIADGAQIAGTITKLPTQSNFIYSLVLTVANIVGFLGFVVAGLVALWLFRGSSARAVGAILTRPIRSLLVGLGVVVVLPLTVAVLAVTLVGIPLAIVVIAIAAVGFVVGAVPAVTALGNRLLLNRGGLFAAFLVGALVWRLGIWLIPYVGGFLFLLGLIWGIGAWVLGLAATRRADPIPAVLVPATLMESGRVDDAWEPPRAPGAEPEAGTAVADAVAPAGAAAVLADEVVAPTREQAPVDAPDEPSDEGRASEPVEESEPGSAEGSTEAQDPAASVDPDPTRQRDDSHERDTIAFGGPPIAAAAQAADGDPTDDEAVGPDLSEELEVLASGADRFDADAPEPDAPDVEVLEADDSGKVAMTPTLEQRLAALRRELDEAEADDDQPFAEYFREQERSPEHRDDATERRDRPSDGRGDGWGLNTD